MPGLDEKGRRLVPGAVARAGGDGGTGAVARLTGAVARLTGAVARLTGAVARLTGASWHTVADGAAGLASFR